MHWGPSLVVESQLTRAAIDCLSAKPKKPHRKTRGQWRASSWNGIICNAVKTAATAAQKKFLKLLGGN